MFREMRRKAQELTKDKAEEVLMRGTSGVLAVMGDDNYPYAVPLSYVYVGSKIFFHSAKTGHKLDAISNYSKVSFCVVDQDKVAPEEYTTYYRSVIVFGRAHILEDRDEKRKALTALAEKYTPNNGHRTIEKVESRLDDVCMVELAVEHISGKESSKIIKARNMGGNNGMD